jgi:hypothetical protein
MSTAPIPVSKECQSENPGWIRSVAFTVEYLGYLITVRSERLPGESVRGSYEIVAKSERAASVFDDRGIAGISSGTIEAVDPQHICEWAKCEIDFLLEEPF